MAKVEIPTAGRIVHYALARGYDAVTRPAIVVTVGAAAAGVMPQLCLDVFIDGVVDDAANAVTVGPMRPVLTRVEVLYSARGAANTWRWPERAAPVLVDVPDEA